MKRTFRNAIRNYYAISEGDGRRYFIVIGDTHVEVEQPVFEAYSKSVRKELYFDEQYDALLTPLDETIELATLSAEEEALHKLALHSFQSAFSQLKQCEQELIVLYYVQGKTLNEIADILNVHFSTVDYRHKKILEKLRKCFLKSGCSLDSQ